MKAQKLKVNLQRHANRQNRKKVNNTKKNTTET